jgi:hypothetical protein
MEKETKSHQLGTALFVHNRIVSEVKRPEFISGRMSFTVLIFRLCNVIVLNVNAPSEEESDNSKDWLMWTYFGFFLSFP